MQIFFQKKYSAQVFCAKKHNKDYCSVFFKKWFKYYVNHLKAQKKEKKLMPCNTTNIYIG